MLIQGKFNTALCYAKIIEQEAIDQIKRMCDQVFTQGSRIRIMPDVHAGAGCTIGTTMTITDKVVPNIVGVDIGCGMYTVELGKINLDFEAIDAVAHYIPSGQNVWGAPVEQFDLSKLRCYDCLRNIDYLNNSLGTLGGGNHFIEIDTAADGNNYLIIHSGSRNLGKQVANYYQNIAIDMHRGKFDLPMKKKDLIQSYKEQNRFSEISGALVALQREYEEKGLDMPPDLCYLYGSYLQDYLHDVNLCQIFARRSRERMAEIVLKKTGMTSISAFHTIHNYIDTEEMILRKGAIAAHENELVLIPINMRDGSVLARGKGNPEWNFSAPHGAGRLMSRSKAMKDLDMETYRTAMDGIYTTSVNVSTLDEAPMAYKSLSDIMDVIQDSVNIIEILKPVYNFKAST